MQDNPGQQFFPWIGVRGGQGLEEGASCIYSFTSFVKLSCGFSTSVQLVQY